MIYIITTMYRLAENRCHELQVSPFNRQAVRIITRAEQCRGIDFNEEKDTQHFLALPSDWDRASTYELRNAWQYVLASSRARRM